MPLPPIDGPEIFQCNEDGSNLEENFPDYIFEERKCDPNVNMTNFLYAENIVKPVMEVLNEFKSKSIRFMIYHKKQPKEIIIPSLLIKDNRSLSRYAFSVYTEKDIEEGEAVGIWGGCFEDLEHATRMAKSAHAQKMVIVGRSGENQHAINGAVYDAVTPFPGDISENKGIFDQTVTRLSMAGTVASLVANSGEDREANVQGYRIAFASKFNIINARTGMPEPITETMMHIAKRKIYAGEEILVHHGTSHTERYKKTEVDGYVFAPFPKRARHGFEPLFQF